MKFQTALFIVAAAPAAAFTGLSAGGKLGFYSSCLAQSLGMHYLTSIAVSWNRDHSTSSLFSSPQPVHYVWFSFVQLTLLFIISFPIPIDLLSSFGIQQSVT
jgi:hypothetical protein